MSKKVQKNTYRPGDHYVIDDRTGFKILASDARKEWNGNIVHKDDWEPKHPSLIYTRVPSDRIKASQPIRTEPADVFLQVDCGYFASDDYLDPYDRLINRYDDLTDCTG